MGWSFKFVSVLCFMDVADAYAKLPNGNGETEASKRVGSFGGVIDDMDNKFLRHPKKQCGASQAELDAARNGGYGTIDQTPEAVFNMEAATVLSSGRWGSPFVSGNPATLMKNGIPCLELNADNKYFEWNVDVGPDSMPIMTLAATFYVNSIPNGRGWLFGDEDGGCDRYMLIHDNRVGGKQVGASCKNIGLDNWHTDGVKVGQWNHMLAHYNQNTRESYVVLNDAAKLKYGISE